MKLKHFYLVVSAMLLTLLASCNQEVLNSDKALDFTLATRADEKPMEIDYSALDTFYFVTDKDIEAYIHYKKLLAESEKREFEVREVVPMGLDDEAILAYLLNYNEGWDIIAADKRAPLPLSTSATGSFQSKEVPQNMMAWIRGLEADVLMLRTSAGRPEFADDEAWKNMQLSNAFWLMINADEDFIRDNTMGTRSVDPNLPIDPPGDDPVPYFGHWELTSSITVNYDSTTVDHIIPTKWHQYADYNSNCPDSRYCSGSHVPAGCLAVAGASLLKYLHNAIGLPLMAPYNAKFHGFYDSYEYTISSMSASQWNNMPYDYCTEPIASLIAYVGHECRMQYGENQSVANMQNFIDHVLEPNCISCSFDTYNPVVTVMNLLNGKPLLSQAFDRQSGAGHAFLIDYYQRYKYCTTLTYEYVYDSPSEQPRPLRIRTEYIYSNGYVEKIRMRWGDNVQFDNVDYALTGNWNVINYALTTNSASIVYDFASVL